MPSVTDPEGTTGPGYWWVTGWCRPAVMPLSDRALARRARRFRKKRARQRQRW